MPVPKKSIPLDFILYLNVFRFEKGEGDVQVEKTQVEIERSADIKKMKSAFIKVLVYFVFNNACARLASIKNYCKLLMS